MLTTILPIALCVVLAVVFFTLLAGNFGSNRQRRGGERSSRQTHVSWHPVILERSDEPDPWTIQLTGSLITPLGKGRSRSNRGSKHDSYHQSRFGDDDHDFDLELPTSAMTGPRSLGSDQPKATRVGVELPTPAPQSLRAHAALPASEQRRPDADADADADAKQTRTTPYRLKQGEAVIISARFNRLLVCEGALFVTPTRIMAVYRRSYIDLLPPRIMRKTRRHQLRLKNLERVNITPSRRPAFLMAGLAIFWWYPWGFFGALICLSAYFFLTRDELLVVSNEDIFRTYPLHAGDIHRIFATLEEAVRHNRREFRKKIGKEDKIKSSHAMPTSRTGNNQRNSRMG